MVWPATYAAAARVPPRSCLPPPSLATPRDVQDEKKPQYLYINSPGGSVTAGLALYDTMGHVSSDVITVNVGAAGGKCCLGGAAAHYPGVLGRPFQARACAAGLGRATEPLRTQWKAAVRP